MSENEGNARPVTGQLVPAERRDVQLPPNTPAGIPFLAQVKYWGARRALEEYTKAISAQAGALRALADREAARRDFEAALVRTEHLDDLRRMEELKVIDELADLVEGSEMREIRRRALRAQAEAEAIEAERRLEAIKNPPAPEAKNEQSAVERATADIAKIRRDGAALKKTIIESCGGEDKLSQEDRDFLSQIDVAIRNKVTERLENL